MLELRTSPARRKARTLLLRTSALLMGVLVGACAEPGGGSTQAATGGAAALPPDLAPSAGGPADATHLGEVSVSPGDDASGPDPADAEGAAGAGMPACDPAPALAACQGCHGPQRAEGGLDLSAAGLAGRLVGVASTRCPGERLIDPAAPEHSMVLTLVDPARYAAAGFGGPGACAVGLMPPDSQGLPAADVACLESWVRAAAAQLEPAPPPVSEVVGVDSALAKVKTLLTGGAPTAEERRQVVAAPEALRALVAAWLDTPEFEAKLVPFLRTALQQDLVGTLDEQLDKPRGRQARLRRLQANVADAFARTASRLVQARRPFTEIATTRAWELTTAVTLALAYADLNADGRGETHTLRRTPPAGAPRPVTVEWMVANRTWIEPSIPDDCSFQAQLDGERLLDFFFGLVRCNGNAPDYRFDNALLLESDFTDWRTVQLSNAGADTPAARFSDLPALRAAEALPLRIRRAGFFTTLAFLANYPTNEDNLFRVTTNQALIVALQSTFNAADPTEPFASEALDARHAAPGTACHGCHKLLDPMRVGLWDAFTPVYQRAEARTGFEARFAFGGFRAPEPVGSPLAFGRALGAHPRFATAWVQRVCYWANAQACDEADPRFQAIAAAFEAGGFDFKAMLVDLFASPLVTGAEPPAGPGPAPFVSITRANHLCPLLETRLVMPGLCGELGASLGLIPKDEFARGDPVPAMTATPSTFFQAAAEALCTRLSNRLVGDAASGRPLNPADVPAALTLLVERLMGLVPEHPRHDAARAALQAHFDEVRAQPGVVDGVALRSAAMVACLSPDVMGMGL